METVKHTYDFTKPPLLPDMLTASHEVIADIWQNCHILTQKVSQLQEQLNQSPSNSSQPPSTEPLHKKLKRLKANEIANSGLIKKKPGALLGHVGKGRSLLPVEIMDEIIICNPPCQCLVCGNGMLRGKLRQRKQLFDLRVGSLWSQEYQVFEGRCIKCHKHYRGMLPAGIPRGILTAATLAKIALLTGKYKLSKRDIVELLQDFYGLRLSVGTISNAEQIVSLALEQPVEELRAAIPKQPVLNVDETSHFCQSALNWLWVVVTPICIVFFISKRRDQEFAKRIIGIKYKGVVGTDRYAAYGFLPNSQRQYCWAHLLRDFRKLSEKNDTQTAYVGYVLRAQMKLFFWYWRRRNDELYPFALQRAEGQRAAVKITLERGVQLHNVQSANFCKKLLSSWECLWHFMRNPVVEPTNNGAERALRSHVIWRKTSHGTQSERGNLYIERMLSIVATCQLQKCKVLMFLERAVAALFVGTTVDSLLAS